MGTELLATGSIVAAFFAGGVALFAPCCIVFLAPSYLAAAAKNERRRLLRLTFGFTAGLAPVLVPITLGASLLAGASGRRLRYRSSQRQSLLCWARSSLSGSALGSDGSESARPLNTW